jgi:hypothetical protein
VYVKIANTSGPVNRLYLEKLGISTKRDNEETIGQFGSGAKFAPIAALRKGWEWISVGHDDFGDYQMRFDVRETAGINEVIFVYDDETVRESSYTLEAGTLSWEDDFQIIREALANAIDAHVEFGTDWYWDKVDHIENKPNEFAVYITDTNTGNPPKEIIDILENIDQWFSINRVDVADNRMGKIFRRVGEDDRMIKIFHKGVRVHEIELDSDSDYIFDYQLNNVTLNEERRLRDAYHINQYVIDCLSELDEDDYGIVRILLENPARIFEFNAASVHNVKYQNWNEVWADQWKKLHGKKAVPVHPGVDQFVISRLIGTGYKPIGASTALTLALTLSGVDSIESILGEGFDIETIELDEHEQDIFNDAVEFCNDAGFDINPDDFQFYFDDDYYAPMGKAVGEARFINTKIINIDTPIERLIGTIIHENDHVVSGYDDANERFRGVADDHIARLIMKGK